MVDVNSIPRRTVTWKMFQRDATGLAELPAEVTTALEGLFMGERADHAAVDASDAPWGARLANKGRVFSPADDAWFDVDFELMRIFPAGANSADQAGRNVRRFRGLRQHGHGDTQLQRVDEFRAAEQARRRAAIRAMMMRTSLGRRGFPPRPTAPQEPWDCEACTLINQPGDMFCAVCGTPYRGNGDAANAGDDLLLEPDADDAELEDNYEGEMISFLEALRMADGDLTRPAPEPARSAPRLVPSLVPARTPPAAPVPVPPSEPQPEPEPERETEPEPEPLTEPGPGRELGPGSGREPPRRGSFMAFFQSARALLRVDNAQAAGNRNRLRARLRSRSSSEGSTASEGTSGTPTVGRSPASSLEDRQAPIARLRDIAASRRTIHAQAAHAPDPPEELSAAAAAASTASGPYTPLTMQVDQTSLSTDSSSLGTPRSGGSVLTRLERRGNRLVRCVELPAGEPAWDIWQWLADTGWESFDSNCSETICAALKARRETVTVHVEIPVGNPRILSRSLSRSLTRPQTFTIDLVAMSLAAGQNGRHSGRPLRVSPTGGGRAKKEKEDALREAIDEAFRDSVDVTEKIIAADPYAECSICLLEFEDEDEEGTTKEGSCKSRCCRAIQLRNCVGHAFHRDCLEEWWMRTDLSKDDIVCPTCMQVYVPSTAAAEN
mmetsp:Transcript_12771/g.47173  ORF Transcript_12771/g.47173 Transcript_12771/m.47173 type:complete len:666 (-) Transcript_12771:578-2575(-)